MAKAMKVLRNGEPVKVKGVKWPKHHVWAEHHNGCGPFVSIMAEAICIHNGPYAPEPKKVEVSVGEVIRIEPGFGSWRICHGWLDGDHCSLEPVNALARKIKAAEKPVPASAYEHMSY